MQTAPNEASGADQSHPRKAVEKLDVPVREVCVCVCVCIQIIGPMRIIRSEEHTSELQSLMRISYAVFCLKKKTNRDIQCQQINKDEKKQICKYSPYKLILSQKIY